MLYLEAPAGVGYSYSADKNYTTDDDQVIFDFKSVRKDVLSLFRSIYFLVTTSLVTKF